MTKKDQEPKAMDEGVGPESRPESRPELILAQLFNSHLAARVITNLKTEELGASELAKSLGHQTVSGELKKQLSRLMDMDLIERTLPNKPPIAACRNTDSPKKAAPS